MSWVYYSDPDREIDQEWATASRERRLQIGLSREPRQPVIGREGRQQLVLPGFERLMKGSRGPSAGES